MIKFLIDKWFWITIISWLSFAILVFVVVHSDAYAFEEYSDVREVGDYTIHKGVEYYGEFNAITIMPIYIQSEPDPKCYKAALNSLGECTDITLHWDEYPLRLMQYLPIPCAYQSTFGCYVEGEGIYLLNNRQDDIVEGYNCTALEYLIKAIRGNTCEKIVELYIYKMDIYVQVEWGLKVVKLSIVASESDLPDLDRKICGLSFSGCAVGNNIYMTGNNGTTLWHEIRHQAGDHPHFP